MTGIETGYDGKGVAYVWTGGNSGNSKRDHVGGQSQTLIPCNWRPFQGLPYIASVKE